MRVNRLGIFQTLSEDGKIDACNLYLAQKIKEVVSHLVIVINGQPNDSAMAKLECIANQVFVRGDTGYDCGAFKQTLEEFIGWEEVCSYEELLLVNDSCYGPIYPLEEMFCVMQDRPFDFWSVTEQPPVRREPWGEGEIPYHVQPYFLVVRSKMLRSRAFQAFWETLKLSDEYLEVVENYELRFTKYFNELGYRSGAYIDCTAFCSPVEKPHIYIYFDPYRLVAKHRSPFLKKKTFLFQQYEVLAYNAGELARKTLDYITERTEYDEDLIWQHLIRKCDSVQLRTALHLDYICSTAVLAKAQRLTVTKAAVVICVHDLNLVQEYLYTLERLEQVDIAVVTDRQKNVGWLAGYPYFCVISDENIAGAVPDQRAARSCMRSLWKNTVANEMYIANVISTFEANRRLGLLSVPMPYASNLFTKLSGLSESFWCRTDAVRAELEKMSVAELISMDIPQSVRGAGYYSGLLMTEEYASLCSSNYQFMMNKLIHSVLVESDIDEFRNLRGINSCLLEFCKKEPKLYIYGAGDYGRRCYLYFQENGISFNGFLVSDGYRSDERLFDYPVYELSELSLSEKTGVILALNQKNSQEAISSLDKIGFKNYVRLIVGILD